MMPEVSVALEAERSQGPELRSFLPLPLGLARSREKSVEGRTLDGSNFGIFLNL